MKLKYTILALVCFATTTITAQQTFRLSQYMQHNYVFNPAAAGMNDLSSIGVTYKKMWEGIEGGPQTTLLFGDTYLNKYKA